LITEPRPVELSQNVLSAFTFHIKYDAKMHSSTTLIEAMHQ